MATLEPINVSTADSTFSNSNGRDRSPKWSKVTTRWSYRDSDTLASDDSNNAVDQVNHVGGVTSWILYSYRQENSAFNRQSTMAWSHMSNVTWPSMAIFMAIFLQTVPHDSSKLFCSINGSNFKWYDMARGWPQQWFDKCSKRTFLQTFTISILALDFSLVGPRPLYSILGNEESRIFGSC